MTGYLPTNVQLGDKLRLVPFALGKHDTGSGDAPHALTGKVVYIHPNRRFATVRFPLEGLEVFGHRVDKSFCECWPIMPDERRLAHKEQLPPNLKPEHSVTEMLQARDWPGMSQGQIAKELGVSQQSVSGAIRTLAKQGIEVKYKKGLTFVQAAQARKAAAGNSSSDSGKEK